MDSGGAEVGLGGEVVGEAAAGTATLSSSSAGSVAEVGLGGEVMKGEFRAAATRKVTLSSSAAGKATLSSSSSSAAAAATRARRHSSIAVVSLERAPASAPGGSALWFCSQELRSQAYLTGVALTLALCSLPFLLAVEPMIVALGSVGTLPNASSSAPCEGLFMDDRGMGYAGGCVIGSWMAYLAASLVLTEVAPNFPRTVPHWLAGSAVNGAIFYVYARSSTDSVSGRALVLITGPSLFAGFMIVPGLSLVGWVVATMHPGPKIAAQLVLACVLWGVLVSVFATAIVIYVVLSDTVNGSAGLLINGTDSDRVVGSALLTR
jgi:hypothetical protein